MRDRPLEVDQAWIESRIPTSLVNAAKPPR
jgi:hypothetical protein